ncbi:MAG: hypothetical protein K5836_06285 [Clostridiales bacterium]|nr:hypothetical protein [Clostridiales bacterium]
MSTYPLRPKTGSVKQAFYLDNENGMSGSKLGMSYTVFLNGNKIATVASSSPKGKSLIATDLYYDVTCEEKDIELVFLVAFSIARTDQLVYS